MGRARQSQRATGVANINIGGGGKVAAAGGRDGIYRRQSGAGRVANNRAADHSIESGAPIIRHGVSPTDDALSVPHIRP